MKLKTAVISVIVSVSLIGGAGYGAYYAIQGQKPPVEVVPVSNVNTGYWGESNSIYGTVTSQVAQTVSLDEEYQLDKVYVKAGDKVKEGTPLFSYDMTLQELELEMEQLSLQTQELTLKKLEKDLDKLKKTPATASLELNDSDLTSSAEEPVSGEETISGEEILSGEEQAGGETFPDDAAATDNSSGQILEEDRTDTTEGSGETASDGLEVEQVEEVNGLDASGEGLSYADHAVVYENLVDAIEALIRTYGEELKSEDIGDGVEDAVRYYREHLAEEQVTRETDNDGNEKEIRQYPVKAEVKEALGEAESAKLEAYSSVMDRCQVNYVDLLIREAVALYGGEDQEKYKQTLSDAWEQYELLATPLQEEVENLPDLKKLPKPEEETETDTEEQLYKVTVLKTGSNPEVFSYEEGATVKLTAESDELQVFKEWKVIPDTLTLQYPEGDKATVEFIMPAEDVTVEKVYQILPDALEGYVNGFISLADEALSEEAAARDDYISLLENAIAYYQQWLAEVSGEIVSDGSRTTMEQYCLKESVILYLTEQGKSELNTQLSEDYKRLCLNYVQALYGKLNPDALNREDLEKVLEAYEILGIQWQAELEQSVPAIPDTLKAYKVLLLFQEYQALPADTSTEVRMAALQQIMAAYNNLTDSQKQLLRTNQSFVDTMKQYGLWTEDQTEQTEPTEPSTGMDFPGGDFDDFGDFGDGMSYTAEELKEMIYEKEREIKDCSLEIKEAELSVSQKQRIVDGKIVKSTLDGTVVSVGDEDGNSDTDYFIKVANATGLYAKGAMNELALEQIQVGDTISGMMTDSGVGFTAVIKEISQYPDPSGGNMSFGSENTNASYYPFYALLDSTEDIDEGEAEIQLSATMTSSMDAIYLEKYFVRKENDGRSYVYRQGEDGLLTKQYVVTGKTVYSYAIEIVSGLELTDKIAFPYGKNVVEGAKTKEVDMLEAYM